MGKIGYFFLKKKETILIISMAFAHFMFTIGFGILKLQVLTVYNTISTMIYMVMLLYSKHVNSYKFLFVASCEIPLYSIITTVYLGGNAGSIIYPFAMLMGVFLYSVNDKYSLKRYILLSIPSVLAILLITLWPFQPVLDAEKYHHIIFTNKISSSVLGIGCILYLSITTHQDLVISYNKNAKYIEKLRFMSNYDPLTKILNRRSTMKKMESINYYTLLMFDIDDFKKFNDTYGHKAGDDILVELCNRISAALPENAVFSRWGGEEFIIIYPDHSDQSILSITGINSVVSSEKFNLSGTLVPITITGGVAFSQPGIPFEKVISAADDLLYTGKNNGKNTIVFPKSR